MSASSVLTISSELIDRANAALAPDLAGFCLAQQNDLAGGPAKKLRAKLVICGLEDSLFAPGAEAALFRHRIPTDRLGVF